MGGTDQMPSRAFGYEPGYMPDWEQQVARIKEATDRYHRPPVHVDSTGAGEPVYEFLLRAGVCA